MTFPLGNIFTSLFSLFLSLRLPRIKVRTARPYSTGIARSTARRMVCAKRGWLCQVEVIRNVNEHTSTASMLCGDSYDALTVLTAAPAIGSTHRRVDNVAACWCCALFYTSEPPVRSDHFSLGRDKPNVALLERRGSCCFLVRFPPLFFGKFAERRYASWWAFVPRYL